MSIHWLHLTPSDECAAMPELFLCDAITMYSCKWHECYLLKVGYADLDF